MMEQHWDSSANAVIQAFLDHPIDHRCFQSFFDFVYRRTLGFLSYLRKVGYRLPDGSGLEHGALDDLAIDILGGFFGGSTASRPYPVIFDYFRRISDAVLPVENRPDVQTLLLGLLKSFVRQELSRLKKQDDPQIDNLKRRFKDLLDSSEFVALRSDSCDEVHLCLSKNINALRPDKPMMPYEQLESIVKQAFLDSHSRSEWCRLIFEQIDTATDFRNLVRKHELLRAVIAVNTEYLDIDAWQPARLPRPQQGYLRDEIDRARDETLLWMKGSIVADFVVKERITAQEADLLATAAEKYLTDYAFDGDTDAIPVYYRETMPESYHPRYLTDHKYVFETIITKSVENFVERLKKDSTIRGLGDYLSNGEG